MTTDILTPDDRIELQLLRSEKEELMAEIARLKESKRLDDQVMALAAKEIRDMKQALVQTEDIAEVHRKQQEATGTRPRSLHDQYAS